MTNRPIVSAVALPAPGTDYAFKGAWYCTAGQLLVRRRVRSTFTDVLSLLVGKFPAVLVLP